MRIEKTTLIILHILYCFQSLIAIIFIGSDFGLPAAQATFQRIVCYVMFVLFGLFMIAYYIFHRHANKVMSIAFFCGVTLITVLSNIGGPRIVYLIPQIIIVGIAPFVLKAKEKAEFVRVYLYLISTIVLTLLICLAMIFKTEHSLLIAAPFFILLSIIIINYIVASRVKNINLAIMNIIFPATSIIFSWMSSYKMANTSTVFNHSFLLYFYIGVVIFFIAMIYLMKYEFKVGKEFYNRPNL